MSRSNPNDVQSPNPSLRFYEWAGSAGQFTYYDKETKQKVDEPLPFSFLPLDRLVTFKGWNDKEKKGYWANEVKDHAEEVVVVKSSEGIEFAGKRSKEFKEKIEAKKINYIESLYIGVKNKAGKLELCNIQIKGAALKPWFEFCKKNKIYEIAVNVNSTTDEKTGSVKFKAPVYKAVTTLKEETLKEANDLDIELQAYLKEYFAKNSSNVATIGEDSSKPAKQAKKEVNKGEMTKEEFEESVEDISFTDESEEPPF